MKNLANCIPSEFLSQTNKIRKSVSKWLTDTDIINIRKIKPELTDDMTEEQKREAIEEQSRKNVWAIFDAILDKHPNETLDLIALLCFVEPENVDDYIITDYMDSFTEMMNNPSVWSFFTSLVRLVNLNI